MQRLDVSYRIQWESNWHVGSGFRTAATDRVIQRLGRRRVKRRVFVPGSQIKGVLRHQCERIALALGLEAVDPHATGPDQSQKLVQHFRPLASSRIMVDRLFGTRFQGECLFVSNALPEKEAELSPGLDSVVRTRTAIDRLTRTVREQRLFSTEMADPRVELAGTIRARHPQGVLTQDGDAFPYEYALLILALLSLDALGGDKSCGLGRCRVQLKEVCGTGVP